MRSALLRGREHVEIGAVSTIAEGRAAVAISPGGAPKAYAHTDPNEDAALFAFGPEGVLLAVADGHWGFEAAEVSLEYLLETPAPHWTDIGVVGLDSWRRQALAVLGDANAEILREAVGSESTHPRTTLALALALPGTGALLHAAVGDSHIFRVAAGEVVDLAVRETSDEKTWFLGASDETAESIGTHCAIGGEPLADTEVLVLATDGLSERLVGVTHPEQAVFEAVTRAREAPPELRARETARIVVEIANDAHRKNPSGDNISAAVVWLAD